MAIVLSDRGDVRLQRVLLETVDLPALLFIGFMLALGRVLLRLLLFAQFDLLPAFFGTGCVFVVKPGRLLGGTSLLIQIGYPHFPGVLVLGHRHQIADFDVFPRLAALAVDMNLTAVDGIGRQTAGFEKPRGPQPFVDPDLA